MTSEEYLKNDWLEPGPNSERRFHWRTDRHGKLTNAPYEIDEMEMDWIANQPNRVLLSRADSLYALKHTYYPSRQICGAIHEELQRRYSDSS